MNSYVLLNECIWIVHLRVETLRCCIWWSFPKFLKGWCVELFSGQFGECSFDDFEGFSIKESFNIINGGISFCLKGKFIARRRNWHWWLYLTILSSQPHPWIFFVVIKTFVFLSSFKSLEMILAEILCEKNVVDKLVEITNWLCVWAVIVPGDEAKYSGIFERVVKREMVEWGSIMQRIGWFWVDDFWVVRDESQFSTFVDTKNTKTVFL